MSTWKWARFCVIGAILHLSHSTKGAKHHTHSRVITLWLCYEHPWMMGFDTDWCLRAVVCKTGYAVAVAPPVVWYITFTRYGYITWTSVWDLEQPDSWLTLAPGKKDPSSSSWIYHFIYPKDHSQLWANSSERGILATHTAIDNKYDCPGTLPCWDISPEKRTWTLVLVTEPDSWHKPTVKLKNRNPSGDHNLCQQVSISKPSVSMSECCTKTTPICKLHKQTLIRIHVVNPY